MHAELSSHGTSHNQNHQKLLLQLSPTLVISPIVWWSTFLQFATICICSHLPHTWHDTNPKTICLPLFFFHWRYHRIQLNPTASVYICAFSLMLWNTDKNLICPTFSKVIVLNTIEFKSSDFCVSMFQLQPIFLSTLVSEWVGGS